MKISPLRMSPLRIVQQGYILLCKERNTMGLSFFQSDKKPATEFTPGIELIQRARVRRV